MCSPSTPIHSRPTTPTTPPRVVTPTCPSTPIYDRFTDPFRSASSSTTATPTPATPRAARETVPGISYGLEVLSAPAVPTMPVAPHITRGYTYPAETYQTCTFANCSTFSLDSKYSTASESFYGDDADDGDEGADALSTPPSSAGPCTPMWFQLEVTSPKSTSFRSSTTSSRSACSRHSHLRAHLHLGKQHQHQHLASPPRPTPAPSLWASAEIVSPESPSLISSYRFLPAESLPTSTLKQQPSATSSWLGKGKMSVRTRTISRPSRPVRPARPSRPTYPLATAPAPFTSPPSPSAQATGTATRVPTELSVFDHAPRQTLSADIEYITGQKIGFPFLASMMGSNGDKKGQKQPCHGKGRRLSKEKNSGARAMEDEWLAHEAALMQSKEEAEVEVEVEVRGRKSSESWREKYTRREYWI